ncbi:hypothetical protein BX661DRAFT_178067 [Kickxella alabastrina]|uniref:uncharacterized protein n=1 Tax=Kickxella alabastrina TaxID=61397 RepID=UPI00221F2994|nr:uncharacterized protein BX661DRAFT_178067 [Kickxella alabastrina]KAI7833282.1 hypothetical protein BX661DRAFT_178067 [Kickxella alabastrina]
MIFVRQERLLRVSKSTSLVVHIYVKESNREWFTDILFQEMLQAIQPALQDKFSESRQDKRMVSVFTNRAFRVGYFIDKSDGQNIKVLLQEPRVKNENETETETETEAEAKVGSGGLEKNLFTYTGLRSARSVLVLVPEPFDANNPIDLPSVLGISVE